MPKPNISIVIPVYNEAAYLRGCLEAVALQTTRPYEVIVVDNNSTDRTAAVARSFPFVTLLHEEHQGVLHARTTGFDAARGDVIARIDADTLVSENWVATLQTIFADRSVGAVSGSFGYYEMPLQGFFDGVDKVFRGYLAWALGRQYALQGANLALRREAWLAARPLLCNRAWLHEDFDLSIHLREAGYTTEYRPLLFVRVAFRQAAAPPRQFLSYALLNPGTYARHGIRRRVVMYPVIAAALVAYPLLHALYLGYDRELSAFSLRKLLSGSAAARVNPATFVE